MRVKISDGIREVEVEGDGDPVEIEHCARRLFSIVAPEAGQKPSTTPAGFNGWSTLSDHERLPE